jgi:hypothetical protein
VVVALRGIGGGNTAPQIFFAELTWKEYALLAQYRSDQIRVRKIGRVGCLRCQFKGPAETLFGKWAQSR